MKLHRAALSLIFVQSVASQRVINGVASPGNFILSENNIELRELLPPDISTLIINSPVPVTIQRFHDANSFQGGEALPRNMAKVLVTSNCDTTTTTAVPVFEEDTSDGSVTIKIDGNDLFNPSDPFLESSSYVAQWKVASDFCGDGPWNQPWDDGSGGNNPIVSLPFPDDGGIGIPAPAPFPDTMLLPALTTCQSDTGCGSEAQFCRLQMGVCDESGLHVGVCVPTPEVCAEIYSPVCGCDGKDYDNECEAEGAGVSVSRNGNCADSQSVVLDKEDCPDGECRDPNGVCGEEVLCFVEPCESMQCGADEACINNMCGGQCTAICVPKPQEITLGFDGGDQTIEFMPPSIEGIIPDGSIEFMPPGNGADQSTSVIEGIEPSANTATTTTATTAAAKVDGSSATTNTAATTIAAVEGDFPTKAPSPSTDDGKSPTSSPFQEIAPGSSSAFGRPRSLSYCIATAFMAIAILSVVVPGNGANNYLLGFGKVVVAAAAVSSIYSKLPAGTRGANTQKESQHSQTFVAQNNGRALQGTCTYNVEILIDGCEHSTEVNAPHGRVIDVSIDNKSSEQDPDDECSTDYRAELNFPVTDDKPATLLNTAEESVVVSELGPWSMECNQPVIGRPFVDATGGTLQAMPMIHNTREAESCVSSLSWTDSATEEDVQSFTGNSTAHSHLMMGEDWTQRALGEHSSVASFSAFSIALMTNQAPSDLVHAALMAGLDEVRHAKVSFDIASKLTGKEVGPGPLPPSSHEFGQDLTALALAVAREGCVDETLSAFSAALEVDHINAVLNEGLEDTFYSDVEPGTLTFIRDALITIAMDESNHSALAWRTLNWVCGIDTSACEAVQKDVFDDETLQVRFNQRADSPFGKKERLFQRMRDEWKKVFNAHMLAKSSNESEPDNGQMCGGEGTIEAKEGRGEHLIASVTESIIHQVSCN